MSEITKINEPAASPLAIIQLATQNGNLNPEALEKLMDLQERHEANNARKAFNKALAAFQVAMPAIRKDRKGNKSKYASYGDIMKIAKPILQKHGLSLSHDQIEGEGAIEITVSLFHTEGHCHQTRFTLPKDAPLKTADGRNITNNAQAQGSANSYCKRYAVCNALDIVLIEEDDDAASLTGETITEEEAEEIKALLESTGSDVKGFLKWAGVSSVELIPAHKITKARELLLKKGPKA